MNLKHQRPAGGDLLHSRLQIDFWSGQLSYTRALGFFYLLYCLIKRGPGDLCRFTPPTMSR